MKFKISKRIAEFGKINARTERHGDEIVPATDIPVTFRGTKRDIDMLLPLMEGKFSELFYNKEGHFIAAYLSPLKVHRKPENLNVSIHDQATSSKKPLTFMEAKVKNIEVTFEAKLVIKVSMTIQVLVDPDSQGGRLYHLMNTSKEIEIESTQDDLFADEESGTIASVADAEAEEEDGDEDEQEQLFEESGFKDDSEDE